MISRGSIIHKLGQVGHIWNSWVHRRGHKYCGVLVDIIPKNMNLIGRTKILLLVQLAVHKGTRSPFPFFGSNYYTLHGNVMVMVHVRVVGSGQCVTLPLRMQPPTLLMCV